MGAVETSLYGFEFRELDKRRERDNEDGQRKFDIKQLWQRSHEILNLALLGHKQTEIAKLLNVHPQTVCNTLNSTIGQETLSRKRKSRDEKFEELQDKVMDLTEKSLKVYGEILENSSESTKLKKETADTIALEMGGLRVPTRIDSRSMHVSLSPEELNELKERGLAAAEASGRLVEVEDES